MKPVEFKISVGNGRGPLRSLPEGHAPFVDDVRRLYGWPWRRNMVSSDLRP